jgi:predicted SAM-dependent methyltransferase
MKDLCYRGQGFLGQHGKETKTSWDTLSYSLLQSHNVYTHMVAVQEANRKYENGIMPKMVMNQFDDEHFDMVIANHILEHIPNDDKAIKEIYRVLKKNGIAILQVPYSETIPTTLESPQIQDSSQQSAMFGQKDHVRIYQLEQYIEKLKQHLFTVKVMRYEALDSFHQFAIQKGECFLEIRK